MKTPSTSSLRIFTALCVSLIFASFSAANPKEELAAAIDKIFNASTYAWVASTEMANAPFPSAKSEGVAEKDGYTVVTRTMNGTTTQSVAKGNRLVTQNRDGDWLTPDEMRARFGGGRGTTSGGSPTTRAPGGQPSGVRVSTGFMTESMSPITRVKFLVPKLANLQLSEGALVATVAGDAAQTWFSSNGASTTTFGPKYTAATVKFWLKENELTKYSLSYSAKITRPDDDETEVNTTMIIDFKNVGTAKIEVPAAAKQKLTP